MYVWELPGWIGATDAARAEAERAIERASGEHYDECVPVELDDVSPDAIRALLAIAEDADSGPLDDGRFHYTMCGVYKAHGYWHLSITSPVNLYPDDD